MPERKGPEIGYRRALVKQRRPDGKSDREAALAAALFRRCCQLLKDGSPAANEVLPQLERFPLFGPGWQELGRALLDARQHRAALVAFSRALAADPGMVAARLGRAAALLALGRPAEAAAECEGAEAQAPDDRDIPYCRGLCLRDASRPEAARLAFERAVSLDPRFAEAWFALGLARQDLHDDAGAVTAYRAALAVRPDFHEAALNLGIACQDAGDLEAALDAYAAALRLRPDSFGRIAQALVSGPAGCLWLDLGALRRSLAARA